MRTRNTFTLIEITLALGVVGIGMVAILGMFPIATNASRDAIGYTHAADSADSFLQLFKQQAKNRWSDYIGDASGGGGFIGSAPDESARNNTDAPTGAGIENPSGNPISRGTIFELSEQGIYHLASYVDENGNGELDADESVDFRGVAAIWQEKSPILPVNKRDVGVLLKVEVSWPAQRPYSAREKELYTLEIFNRN